MSFMFEVYYKAPINKNREKLISREAMRFGVELTFREEPGPRDDVRQSICLTYEFDNLAKAEEAAEALRILGEHVEGPCDYGPP